jgi:hypothetical protein
MVVTNQRSLSSVRAAEVVDTPDVYQSRFSEGTGLAELVVFHESQLPNVGISGEFTESVCT